MIDIYSMLFCPFLGMILTPAVILIWHTLKEHRKQKAHAIVREHLNMLCDENGNLMEYEEAMLKLAEIGITDKIDIITYSSMRTKMRYEFISRGYGDGQR